MSNIDFTKPVETVTGIPVQIISTSGREPYPVVGYVGEHSLCLEEWTSDGLFNVEELDYSDYNLRNKATQPEEPWAAEKAAFAAGETIEVSCDESTWVQTFIPEWRSNLFYRIKPKPQKVPLEPCDVPPGSVFRAKEYASGRWKAPVEVSEHGVNFERRSTMTFQQLSESGWQIKRPTDTEWQPCWKKTQP
jgi:hypothetical protein